VAVVAAGRQVTGGAVLAHRLDAPRLAVCDRHKAEFHLPAVMREPDHVGGVKCKARGRQAEGRGLAADPGLHQRAAAAAFVRRVARTDGATRLTLGRHGHGEGLGGDAGGVDGDAPRFDEGCVIVLVGTGDLPLQRLRQFGFLAAGQLEVLALADRLRGADELARGRDQGHGAGQPLGGVGVGQRPEHLEGQLRQAVAVGRKRQFREDDTGRAAPGRGVDRAHPGRDEGIGRLRLASEIQAPGDAGHVHGLAVGPDAADAGDSPPCRASSASILSTGENGPSGTGFGAFAERHGKAGEIQILGRLHAWAAAALAAALPGSPDLLAEIGRPDDVAADAHATVEARDDRALGRRRDPQAVETLALDPLRRRERRHDPAVDRRADGGADEAADGCGADAQNRPADSPADGGADGAEDKRGDCENSAWREEKGEH
jgi:hypothetical protein